MKQVSILLLSYLLLLLITISCKENFEIQSQEISISEAKDWFENYSKSNQPAINNNSQNSQEGTTASIVKQIYWDKAKRLKKDKGLPEGFAIPIWYEAKYRFGKQSIRELWISKDDKGEMKAQVIEILGTDEYFNANGNKLDMTNFTGGITIHDWKDGFQGGIYYKNGVRIGYINEYIVTTNIQPALKKIDNNQRVSDCGYQYSYVNNGEIYIVWVYQLCMSDWWMLYYNNPYHAQAWIDSQYGCEVTSTCVGDTNPPPYYEPPVDYEQIARDDFNYYRINDSQLRPCMQQIMGSLKTLTNGSVSSIIQKFSGSIPGWNWDVKDGSLVGGQNAFTSQAYNRVTGTVTTTFDGSKFISSTDLSVARTILHESVHANLVAYFNTDPLAASKSYPDLVNDWAKGIYGDQNANQHAEFVRNFVNEIAMALEEYGTINGYNLTPQFYQDLAWGGLTHTGKYDTSGNPIETTWFQATFPSSTDRKRVIDNISIEQTGKDFYGNTKAQKGGNAGC